MLEMFFKSNHSSTVARQRFCCAHFNNRRLVDAPSATLVYNWVKRFQVTASTVNQKVAVEPDPR